MSTPSQVNPLARWLASWRFAWRTALLDLHRKTGATALSLLLVIVPIAVTVMGTTAIVSTNSARALHLANPAYKLLLQAVEYTVVARTSIGNADWATLTSVMLAVAAVAPIVAALCLPQQDRGIRRVH